MTLHILWKASGLRYRKGPRVRTIPRPLGWTDSFEDYQKWSVYLKLKR